MQLGQKVYEASQAQQNASAQGGAQYQQNAGEENTSNQSSGDDTMDASFEEVK